MQAYLFSDYVILPPHTLHLVVEALAGTNLFI